MPRDLEGLADVVVLTVKTAMAPVLERLALVEQENANLKVAIAGFHDVRDRVVAVETKAAMPISVTEVPPVDLSPLLARLSVLEQAQADTKTALGIVTELRDRVVAVETKAAMPLPLAVDPPPPADLTPVLERMASVEAHVSRLGTAEQMLSELRDRVVVVETKNAMPVAPSDTPEPVDLAPVWSAIEAQKECVTDLGGRLATVETKNAPTGITSSELDLSIRERLDPVLASIAEARERLVAVETRAPTPGPPGKDGERGTDGKDGTPGRDGVDGLGFDDMDAEFNESLRMLTLKFQRGQLKKTFPILLPYLQYEGVYIEGKSYERGSVVTWAGSTWHANEQTTLKPGEGSKAWTLIVKRGRDGKDGRDAMDPMPVVSVKR
jgi:hypothetical protein